MSRRTPSRRATPRANPRSQELLFEIGTEELPSQFIPSALSDVRDRALHLLKDARISHGEPKTLGTPRRLTLVVPDLADFQEPLATEAMGPSKAVAFDAQGQPTRAATGFAASHGLAVAALEVRTTPKGEYLFAVKREAGRKTSALLPDLLQNLLGQLSFPKAMRWNASGVRFARPIRWLVAVHERKPIRFSYAGITGNDRTYGHRFLSSNKALRVTDFKIYVKSLLSAGVVADPEQRRSMIVGQLERLAKKRRARLVRDEALLEQAVYTVEMPYALAGEFDRRYLVLPKEVLMTAMKEHQGYFSLLAEDGALLPVFITVTNMAAAQESSIRAGNERVLAARLADAKFFFDEDRKRALVDRVEQLKGIVFHQKLGTVYDKVQRMIKITAVLAPSLIIPHDHDRVLKCSRASLLCKADLTTGMVREFPDLQGVLGGIYARYDDEDEEVSDAISEHYLPKSAEDSLPISFAGRIVSIADRLDTVTSFFAVRLVPSGSQDPYALRRHAYAVIRILLEAGLSLDLRQLIEVALQVVKEQGIPTDEDADQKLYYFFVERLRYYLSVVCQIPEDLIDAVLSFSQDNPFNPVDLRHRAEALQIFKERAEFVSLLIGYKRAVNITKKEKYYDDNVMEGLLKEDAERKLYYSLQETENRVSSSLQERKYHEVLETLVSLKEPIDNFFDAVMVMVEDEAIRRNRLALLTKVRKLFRRYCDFSVISEPIPPGKLVGV